MLLPREMSTLANRDTNEEAWRMSDFPRILGFAVTHKLACVGGQFQFRGPIGTAEMYWLSVDSIPRKFGEDWDKYVERANLEVLQEFNRLVTETDFNAEARNWKHIVEAIEEGKINNPLDHLYFVAYFDQNQRTS